MWQEWSPFLTFAYYGAISVLILSILLDNRNPAKTAGYILMLIFLPVIGLVFYLFFGQDFRKRKIFNTKGFRDSIIVKGWIEENQRIFNENKSAAQEKLGDLVQVSEMLRKNYSFVEFNNSAKLLLSGDEKFDELIKALKNATHHIHLEYYIIEDDKKTQAIFEILIEKAQKGVHVRVIYDDVGSRSLPNSTVKNLKRNGIEIYPFMPVYFPFLTSNANYRNHRKIAVIDGLTGFIGGINLSKRYSNRAKNDVFWRDTHLRIDGAAVRQLQVNFMLSWNFVSGETLPIQIRYFPEIPTYRNLPIQIAVSGPDSEWAFLMMAFFKAISVASHYVYITTPYFIPNDQILSAIQAASLSGIDVQLIIPGKSDSKIVHAATMSYVKELLRAGARVFLYDKGFIHAKTMVVDGLLGTIGTANMDQRSFDINFEVNAFIYDEEINNDLKESFEMDKEDCTEIFLDRWEKRRITKRIIESIARLLAPLL